MPQIRVPRCAVAQFGVFTRSQAYDDGWTPRQTKRWVQTGAWHAFAGQGLAARDHQVGPWQVASALHLTWPDAVISHELAGALWRFPVVGPTTATATVPPERKVRAAGVRTIRTELPTSQVELARGIPITSRVWTATDLLATLEWDAARNLFGWLSTRGVLDQRGLDFWIHERRTRAGTRQLRRLLAVSAGGSLSPAEDRFHELLRTARITGWRPNAKVVLEGRLVAVVDVLFEAQRVVVEVDGWSTHSGRAAFQRDRVVRTALAR